MADEKQAPKPTKTWGSRLGTIGGICGLIVMFMIPTGGSLAKAALIGAACGGGGAVIGGLIGGLIDAQARKG